MADPVVRVGVGVFVFKNGKFLMGQRRGSHGANSWSIPGGHMEFGETLEDTAAREVKEETGLEIKNIRFGAVTTDFFPKDNKQYLTVWMLSDYDTGQATVTEPDFFVKQMWASLDKLPSPLFSPWHNLLASNFMDSIKKEAEAS